MEDKKVYTAPELEIVAFGYADKTDVDPTRPSGITLTGTRN